MRAKFGARGALTTAYFITLAAALGFTITITEFSPYTVDMPCDEPLLEPEWAFIWQVNAPQITTFYFSVEESSLDDPLETYDANELVCRITQDAWSSNTKEKGPWPMLPLGMFTEPSSSGSARERPA